MNLDPQVAERLVTDEAFLQRYLADEAARRAARPVKRRCTVATAGAVTADGGEVVAASDASVFHGGKPIARVGDTVRYRDGSETTIISGAGAAIVHKGRSVALVGSHTENGDRIVSTPITGLQITEFADGPLIEGLLVPGLQPAGK